MHLEHFVQQFGRSVKTQLSSKQPKFIVLRSNHLTVTSSLGSGDEELGRVTLRPGGTKLEAVKRLTILPGRSHTTSNDPLAIDTRSDKYELEPASEGRCEIFILRHGDVIVSPGTNDGLTYVYQAPEVQVNASAAEVNQAEPLGAKDGVKDTPEDETEDEDEGAPEETITEVPVTQPATQSSKSQPSATPHLATHRSVLVHETPTTDRTFGVADNENRNVESTPPPQGAIAITETFLTTQTGQSPKNVAQNYTDAKPATDRQQPQRSPKVRLNGRPSRKRANPTDGSEPAPELSAEEPPGKRTRTNGSTKDGQGDVEQAGPLDQININPSRHTYSAKGKKRSANTSEATPTKSSRSSQRSGTATTAVAYEGEPPRVATSNSAIKDGSPIVKFLRKHGGTLVTSVEDKCNVLCVRDGGLAKTMKVIQAIALGIPIVTDKWLSDSAKAEGFLDLSSYKPSVIQQEEEWGFNLEKVWGVAQTPFKGYSIYFTPALKKTYTNFREMDRVCQTFGAKVTAKRISKNDKLVVLATEEDDPDADKMIEDGETCYHKDLLTTSILRGTLDLESDEFKIKPKHVGVPRRKGSRKST